MTAARPRLLLAPALAGSLLLASLLLAGCSQPDSGSDEAARAHASAAASQASQPAAAGGQPSATPSPNVWLTTPAVGARVSGKAYSVALAPGWADITVPSNEEQPDAGFDLAVQDAADSDGFASYLTVLSSGVADMVGRTGFADFLKEELEGGGAKNVVVLPETSLDGSRVLRLRGEMSQGELAWHTEQWVVSHGQDTYVISFNANRGTTDAQMATLFGPVVSSWQWSD